MNRKTVSLLIIVLLVVVGIGVTCWCKLSAFLEEDKSHKTLSGTTERLDLGDEPAPDLKVKIWGLQRVSPGQKITYIIEYRNDGLKASGKILLFVGLDYSLKYILASPGAYHNDVLNTVDWDLGNLPVKSSGYLSIQVEVAEGLPQETILETDAIINERPHGEKKRTYMNIEDMSSSTSHTVTTARNANEKLVSPVGDVRSGDRLDYTINYENEGEDIAYGVYITDILDGDLDISTLVINNNGSYDPGTRTITWFIGEVGSHHEGSVTFGINVKSDTLDNAEVINFVTVYFPSVSEVTRTNGTANRIVTTE